MGSGGALLVAFWKSGKGREKVRNCVAKRTRVTKFLVPR